MDKNSGIDYDRQAFIPASQSATHSIAGPKAIAILVLAALAIAFFGFLGYRMSGESRGNSSNDTREFVEVDLQIAQIQERLDQVEQENHRLAAALSLVNSKKAETSAPNTAAANAPPKIVVYRVSPTIQQPRAAVPDPATMQKLAALQQGLGAAQNDASANREALQATVDRLADVAGQVGSQHGEILRGQDDLNRLLAQTERSSLSFEIRRGSPPETLGPVSVVLKSANAKNQRYTVCVYVQGACVELKDRTLYEVVQVAVARTGPPLEVIATKIGKDSIAGYLEVPRAAGH
jgi:hypothetical protein